jgi:hypothetical protein
VANITIFNNYGETLSFGSYDWRVGDDYHGNDCLYSDSAEDPWFWLNYNYMMPLEFELEDRELANYDVVVNVHSYSRNPYLTYIEIGESNTVYASARFYLFK